MSFDGISLKIAELLLTHYCHLSLV